ncbi:MAG: hypothetical protein HY897_17740 [Deltaproteobacteria bacterium]|nr:hypothetical protein [Deltaproteobacteria bacterium]
MKRNLFCVLGVSAAAAVVVCLAACSSDPCEDLEGMGEPCSDEVVRAMALDLVEKDDKNQCRLYRDAWYVTYQPRCDTAAADAGAPADAGMTDAGFVGGGGTDGGAATD